MALVTSVSQSIVDEQALPLPLAGQALAILENASISEGSLLFELPKERLSTGIFQTDSPTDRYVDYLYFVSRFEDQYIVAAEIFERQEELLDALDLGLQLALWISLLLTGAAGIWLGRRAQTRIDVIGHGLSRVAQGELSARIDLQGGHDDLNALSDLINATTERLDGLVGQMRVQTSNIAHDLRTPLARPRAGLETAQIEAGAKGKGVPVDYIEGALVQVDHIIGTFGALLRLARIENSAR
jgi:signal transduction histidine kinase